MRARAGTDVWIRWQDVVHRLHVEECQPAESIQIVEVRLEVDLLPAPHSGPAADVRNSRPYVTPATPLFA
jgi:hypothetical protein